MEQTNWLVIFLIYADFRVQGLKNNEKTFRELENVLKDLKNCKISKGTKIVFTLNGIRFTKNGEVVDYTYIYQVRQDLLFCDNVFECIEVVDNNNSRNPNRPLEKNQLVDIFEKIKCAINYTNERIILNTWDHGSAFGIFKGLEKLPVVNAVDDEDKYPALSELLSKVKKDSNEKSLMENLKDKSQSALKEDLVLFKNRTYYSINLTRTLEKSYFREEETTTIFKEIRENINSADIIFKEEKTYIKFISKELRFLNNLIMDGEEIELKQDGEILTNIELADAIKLSFTKVDILTMMNCWMMNLDSLYTFKHVANYFVTASGNIDEPGYNYFEIIKITNKYAKSCEIAKCFISSIPISTSIYRNLYLKQAKLNLWFVSGYNLSDLDIEKFENLLNNIDSSIKILFSQSISEILKNKVGAMIDVTFKYDDAETKYELRDALHIVENIISNYHDFLSLRNKPLLKELKTLKDILLNLKRIINKNNINQDLHSLRVFNSETKGLGKTIGYNVNNLISFFPNTKSKLRDGLDIRFINHSLLLKKHHNYLALLRKLLI